MKITLARRVPTTLVPKANSAWARAGLRYERNLARTLQRAGIDILHNPQFYYETPHNSGYCLPDIVLLGFRPFPIVIEVKLSYREEAIEKLRSLYCPVLRAALGVPLARPVVVTKVLRPDSPSPEVSLESLLCSPNAFLIQWLGRGEFPLT